jgi:hypothetical protein
LIIWHGIVQNGTINHEYSPDTLAYIAFVAATHSSNSVSLYYSLSILTGKAPAAKVQTLSEFAIPIGILLTVPWLNKLLRARRRAQGTSEKPNT